MLGFASSPPTEFGNLMILGSNSGNRTSGAGLISDDGGSVSVCRCWSFLFVKYNFRLQSEIVALGLGVSCMFLSNWTVLTKNTPRAH